MHICLDEDCLESSMPSDRIQRILQMAWNTHILIYFNGSIKYFIYIWFYNQKISVWSVSSLVKVIMAKLWSGYALRTLVNIPVQHQGQASIHRHVLPNFSNCNIRMTWGLVTAGPVVWEKLLIKGRITWCTDLHQDTIVPYHGIRRTHNSAYHFVMEL